MHAYFWMKTVEEESLGLLGGLRAIAFLCRPQPWLQELPGPDVVLLCPPLISFGSWRCLPLRLLSIQHSDLLLSFTDFLVT